MDVNSITNYDVYPFEDVPYEVCDNCIYHEPHYCTLHSCNVRNTNINSCKEFEEKLIKTCKKSKMC